MGAQPMGAYYGGRPNLPIGFIHETARDQQVHGLGQACPSCYIPVHGECVACPNGSSLPECVDCEGGRPMAEATPWYERPLAGPVIVGLVSAVALGIAVPVIRRQLGRRGIRVE